MTFEVGDYVMRKKDPSFVWRVIRRTPQAEIEAIADLPSAGDNLILEVVCNLDGRAVDNPFSVKQEAWSDDLEQAPAMLVLAWESR